MQITFSKVVLVFVTICFCYCNNEYLFISGGVDRRNYSTSSSAFVLDLNTLKVEAMPGMIAGRHSHSVAPYKHNIFVFGGQSVDNKVLQSCCIFNLRERVWYKIPSMKVERKNSQFFVNNKSGVVYVLGGSNQNGNEIKIIEKLDTTKLTWSVLRYDTSIGLNLRDFIILKAVNDNEDRIWILSRSRSKYEGRLAYELFSFDLDQEKFIHHTDFSYSSNELDFGFIVNQELYIFNKGCHNRADVYLGNGLWIQKTF